MSESNHPIKSALKKFLGNRQEPPFLFCIDFPQPNQAIESRYLSVSGWVATEKSQRATNFRLCDEGSFSYSLDTIDRPDVQAVYPDRMALGFVGSVAVADLPPSQQWWVRFDLDGTRQDIPLSFEIDRQQIEDFWQKKTAKLAKISEILQCPLCGCDRLEQQETQSPIQLHCTRCGGEFHIDPQHYNFLPPSLKEYGSVKTTENVSANAYDPTALELIERFRDGLILDNGCGLRQTYYDNVVNFEIVNYPTTDVLGIGEKLPFKSNSFDAVFSLAVLEHVKTPVECAREISRVLKPGGILYVVVPFLQPFHGYPDHYYNMTSSGLKNLFNKDLEIIEAGVPLSGVPIWCLTWFLNSYIRGLPEDTARKFKNLKISDLLDNPLNYLKEDFVKELAASTNEELASTNYLIARKPLEDPETDCEEP
ncbi:methyltransferase domain-containing protein [Baaleninema sp.]|uniref:methyltransferase domain-containing protein n=1 Tax=Baaleninema sp. TaxID=3101197 RepID=UPI003D028ED9